MSDAQAFELWNASAYFSSASSEVKVLGAFFCNFLAARQPESPMVSRATGYQMLWVRGFRDHTISRRGFNLFKPLRRHFPATCRQTLSRRDPGAAGARHREQSEATQTKGLQPRRGLDCRSPSTKLRPLVATRAYRTRPDRGCTKAKALGGVGHVGSCLASDQRKHLGTVSDNSQQHRDV